jgi:hypothetical protein
MRIRMRSTALVWFLPALGLLACRGKQQNEENAMANTPAGGMEQQQAMASPAVMLAAKNNSGLTGSFTTQATGDSTTITVTLHNGTPGTSYPTHVHSGTCANPGAVVQPLSSVMVGPDSTGTASTTMATSVLTQGRGPNGSLLVQSHLPDGTPAACGEIPAGS